MREHLLGYLMGALDASQQREVEQALENDPQLRRELALMNEALEPLRADCGLYEPPIGLADRALDAVAAVAGWPEGSTSRGDLADDTADEATDDAKAEHEGFLAGFFGDELINDETPHLSRDIAADLPMPATRRSQKALGQVREVAGRSWADRWVILDVVASASVVAAAAMLFFPAIANSRFQSRVVACQSNLQTIGEGLANYSDNHGGSYPPIPQDGNLSISGVYAGTLSEGGYVPQAHSFFCAGDVAASTVPPQDRRIPTLAEIDRAFGQDLRMLQRLAGGSYGYNLGVLVDGQYHSLRHQGRPRFAILADAPGPQSEGRHSRHHEGRGQNVLFDDGHIEFLLGGQAGFDEIFYSDRNLVEAGNHADDAVIGDSHSRPVLFTPVGSKQRRSSP